MTSTTKTQLTIRLDAELYCKIQKISLAENRTLTNMIEYLVKQEIRRFESDNGEVVVTDRDYPTE